MRNGDRQAFAALYERREPALFRYAVHLSESRQMAEEVTQDVFVQLFSPANRFDPGRGSLEAYLYGVVRNLIRAASRKSLTAEPREEAAGGDVLGDLIQDEATAALYAALRELPEPFREAVVLCDLEERSYEDAARLMACPVGTVRSRLHRARMLLAARLRPLKAVAQ